MYWTRIAINPATEAVVASTLDLSHDGPEAETMATKRLPGKTIVAMIKGNHSTSTYLPAQSLSLYRTERR